jgi:uncharacterized protein DUF1360
VAVATEARPDGRPEAPTEPVDYRLINAVYAAMLAGVVLGTRKRGARDDPITGSELIPIAGATFALSKLVAREKIATWMREPFVDEERRRPRGRRLRRAVGELLTCTRCVGAWSALGVVGLRLASPQSGRVVTQILAASAANDFLQAGFKWLCEEANTAER